MSGPIWISESIIALSLNLLTCEVETQQQGPHVGLCGLNDMMLRVFSAGPGCRNRSDSLPLMILSMCGPPSLVDGSIDKRQSP